MTSHQFLLVALLLLHQSLFVLVSAAGVGGNETDSSSSPSGSFSSSSDGDSIDVYIAPEEGWTQWELQCLNEMETADTTYDHMLNHHEYFVFADIMANRLFGMVDALDEESEWELEDLYEDLVLMNPRDEITGIDIFGSSYGALRNINEQQVNYLKSVCSQTKAAIVKIGPDDSGEDSAEE